MNHRPVMVDEVLLNLGHIRGGIIIDGTLGQGGHTEALLMHTPEEVTIVGIDRDESAVRASTERLAVFGSRFRGIHGSYRDHNRWQDQIPKEKITGFLLDLGLSSNQLELAGRGFSFRDPKSLDMRFDPSSSSPTAADLVNTLSESMLADIIFRYGEERASRKIARAIVRRREITRFTTAIDLSNLIAGLSRSNCPIHPATKTFQALRIAVNHELEHLKNGLETAKNLLDGSGRLVVISYHSLEDRIVKQFFINNSGKCICPGNLPVCRCDRKPVFRILTRKPVTPLPEEINFNPRSRSAKLRCAERIREEGVAA